jgi:hypothetical protein
MPPGVSHSTLVLQVQAPALHSVPLAFSAHSGSAVQARHSPFAVSQIGDAGSEQSVFFRHVTQRLLVALQYGADGLQSSFEAQAGWQVRTSPLEMETDGTQVLLGALQSASEAQLQIPTS